MVGCGVYSYDFLLLPITPSVSCSWLDALNTPGSELPLSPAVSHCPPLSPAFCNPSKFAPQPPSPDPEIVAYRRSAALPIAKWVNPVATAPALVLHAYTMASEGALALQAADSRER